MYFLCLPPITKGYGTDYNRWLKIKDLEDGKLPDNKFCGETNTCCFIAGIGGRGKGADYQLVIQGAAAKFRQILPTLNFIKILKKYEYYLQQNFFCNPHMYRHIFLSFIGLQHGLHPGPEGLAHLPDKVHGHVVPLLYNLCLQGTGLLLHFAPYAIVKGSKVR